jgi:O-antigen ligase
MSIPVLLLVCVLVATAFIALPAIPTPVVLGGILFVRSLSDIGASTGGSLIPSSAVSGALGLLAIVAALVPTPNRPSAKAIVFSGLTLFLIASWTLVGMLRFGLAEGMLTESVRLVSLVAIALLATKVAKDSVAKAIRILILASFPAAVVLCIGFFARIPVTISFSGRAVGSFSHANAAAAFMGLLALLLFALFLRDRRRGVLVLALISVLALLLTQSLGGLSAFAAGVAVLIILSTSMSAGRKVVLAALAVGAATIAFSVSGASQRVSEFQSFNAEAAISSGVSDDSLGWRFINWNLLLQAWRQHPLVGFGPGSTQTFVMPLGAPPHSAFVQILVETGLIGASVVALALLVLFRRLRHGVIRKSWSALTATAVLAALIVNGSESNLLGYTATMYFVVALFAVLLVSVQDDEESMVSPAPSQSRQASSQSGGLREVKRVR